MCLPADGRKMHLTICYLSEIMALISGANSDKIVSARVVVKLCSYDFSSTMKGRWGSVVVGRDIVGRGCTTVQPYVFDHFFS